MAFAEARAQALREHMDHIDAGNRTELAGGPLRVATAGPTSAARAGEWSGSSALMTAAAVCGIALGAAAISYALRRSANVLTDLGGGDANVTGVVWLGVPHRSGEVVKNVEDLSETRSILATSVMEDEEDRAFSKELALMEAAAEVKAQLLNLRQASYENLRQMGNGGEMK